MSFPRHYSFFPTYDEILIISSIHSFAVGHLGFFQFCSINLAGVIRPTFKILNLLFIILGIIVLLTSDKTVGLEEEWNPTNSPISLRFYTRVGEPWNRSCANMCPVRSYTSSIDCYQQFPFCEVWLLVVLNKFPSSFSDVFSPFYIISAQSLSSI